MQRQRVLIVFGIAWASALLLSWWVFKTSTAPQKLDVVSVVAAAQDLPMGRRIRNEDLKLITLVRKDLPKGAVLKMADLVDRALAIPVSASEPILLSKLAAKGAGEGLTALIDPGARAVSVQVNEISSVSGFIQPGARVDVIFTRIFTNGDAATTTILKNVKVIAYGRQFDPGAKADPRDNSRPTVATLLLSQDQAERLVLAAQRGRIQLALRNNLDGEISDATDPVQAADLGISEPKRVQAVAVANAAPAAPPKVVLKVEPKVPIIVRVFRGEKVTEEKIQ